jgi:glutamyl-tRNA reductase
MIGVVGLNHETAPVALRERFVFDEAEIVGLIRELPGNTHFEEIVVLSTCNRSEIYFSATRSYDKRDFDNLIFVLCRHKGIEEDLRQFFYAFEEQKAVGHLFCVAAGINSQVLGENQILGQIREAYRISVSRRLTDTVLNHLFPKALEVGKAVRTETSINEGASSVGYAAVELAGKVFKNLPENPVLLIGAGELGELVLQSLVKRGSRHVHIINRTEKRARVLAAKYQVEAAAFGELAEHFQHHDIIIASTASSKPVVKKELVDEAMERRNRRSLFLIDLSVPRAVEEGVGELEDVFVFDIDDLDMVVSRNREKRGLEIEKAERIVETHCREFFTWLSNLELAPTIAHLKERFAAISRRQLVGLKKSLPEETYTKVQEFDELLQGKYLGLIIKNLRTLPRDGRQQDVINIVSKLFELHDQENK